MVHILPQAKVFSVSSQVNCEDTTGSMNNTVVNKKYKNMKSDVKSKQSVTDKNSGRYIRT